MIKTGRVLPCNESPQQINPNRSTTNSMCYTNERERHFISKKTFQLGNLLIPIPCFLVAHEAEFIELSSQVGYLNAVRLLAVKYKVNLAPTIQNKPRYRYPSIVIHTIPRTIQFHKTFVLGTPAPILPYASPNPNWSIITQDAKYVNVFNNDTITFSTTLT